MPTYFNEALGYNLTGSSALSALPYVALWAFCLIAGFLVSKKKNLPIPFPHFSACQSVLGLY
jgi:hypothetical protein